MQNLQKITPCLWFDDQAEEAAQLYISIFKNSKILTLAMEKKGAKSTASRWDRS